MSAVLPHGQLLETVFRSADEHPIFLYWNGTAVEEARNFEVPGVGKVVPYSGFNSLLAHNVVLLPSDATAFRSIESLITSVREFIHRYADLSRDFEEVAAHYVLLTWVHDAFSELPYLRLRGEFGSGKTRCLQTIGSLCYRPMFASGATTVSPLFRMIDAVQGTLVIDESDFRRSDERTQVVKILNNGNAVGFPVLRSESVVRGEYNPVAFNVFGPKIIASRRPFEDKALESRCITEVMPGLPPRKDIPLNLPKAFHGEALGLRNQLLMYRFRHHTHMASESVDRIDGLLARVEQVFRPLLNVASDEKARERIVRAAQTASASIGAGRAATIGAHLLRAIQQLQREHKPLAVNAIAELVGKRPEVRPDGVVTPRWVGGKLRDILGLRPVKSNGTFVLRGLTPKRLDQLYTAYRIDDDGMVMEADVRPGRA